MAVFEGEVVIAAEDRLRIVDEATPDIVDPEIVLDTIESDVGEAIVIDAMILWNEGASSDESGLEDKEAAIGVANPERDRSVPEMAERTLPDVADSGVE